MLGVYDRRSNFPLASFLLIYVGMIQGQLYPLIDG